MRIIEIWKAEEMQKSGAKKGAQINLRKRFDLPFSADEFNKWLYEARFLFLYNFILFSDCS